MISIAQFRNDIKAMATQVAIGDQFAYSDESIQFWLNIAKTLLNPCRWGPSAFDTWPSPLPTFPATIQLTKYDLGCELYVAHNLVLEAQGLAAAANGLPSGVSQGPINNKSVDKVSIGFDTQASSLPDAGDLNLTVYGTRFLKLARFLGHGPIMVNLPGSTPGGTLTTGAAWPGPPIAGSW